MSKSKKRRCRCWAALLLAAVLSLALAPAALADTGSNTPKITQQPDQLILQLGTRWAGVEFELRTDAGVFPVPVVVDEGGVLRMDLGGQHHLHTELHRVLCPHTRPDGRRDAWQ